jgi:hypothetical protein
MTHADESALTLEAATAHPDKMACTT